MAGKAGSPPEAATLEAQAEASGPSALRGSICVTAADRSLILWRQECGVWQSSELRRGPFRVTDVSLNDSATHVASVAGTAVAVDGLSGGASWTCTFPKPVLTVAICPQYAEAAPGLRVLCSGGEEGRLVLSRRGSLETRHATLHHGEGPITAIRWRGGLVAWVNSKGVKVVDVETYQKVTYIARPPGSVNLCWLSDDALLIGGDQDILLAEFHSKLGGPSGVRFARISQRFALSGDFVHSLAQLDAAQLPKSGALCEALRLWPKTTKPTKPLMAALQRALRPEGSIESGEGPAWEPQAENCEESGASEVLASLHEARGDATSALRLLAAAGSQRVFALLRRHLGQGADLGAVSAVLPRLVALHPGQMADLAAAHPESLKPAELLAALAPHGAAWELRYLRLLAWRSPDAAKHFRDRMVQLTAELRPHHLRPVFVQSASEEKEETSSTSSVHGMWLEAAWASGSREAASALLALGHPEQAFHLQLFELGSVHGALDVLTEAKLPEEKEQELLQELCAAAVQDGHLFASLLAAVLSPSGGVPGMKVSTLFQQLPPGLEVPTAAVALLLSLDCDLHELALTRLRRSAADAALALQTVVPPPFQQTDEMYFTQMTSATVSKVLVHHSFCGCVQRLLQVVVVGAVQVQAWQAKPLKKQLPEVWNENCRAHDIVDKRTVLYSKAAGTQQLSVSADITGEALKERLREALGLDAEVTLALSFQNGSRNSVKKVLEAQQSLGEQGVEDGASLTVKADAVEVRPENSFLRESIRNNGGNSYYYAHANEKELPPELRYVYGGEPIKLESQNADSGDAIKASAARPLTKYSWADEGDFVCIYVSAEGEPEAIEAAICGEVKVSFDVRSVEVRVCDGAKEFALSLKQLEGEIVAEESKHRVSAGKRTMALKTGLGFRV
ncbi:Vps41 [Symbiodinium sp. CCMP2456]|nr:Vps41 [Symbiodinium sp. CCMP2456]